MTGVVSLHGNIIPDATLAPDKDVIEVLEQVLAEAKSGELQGIAYAAVYHNDDSRNEWTGNVKVFSLFGAIAMLYHEYTDAMMKAER